MGTVDADALAYVDNGDGTITDSNTGLMWEKLSYDGSIHDWTNTYTFDQAFPAKVATLNSASFAGYSDWRVPNMRELHALVDASQAFPAISLPFRSPCWLGCSNLTCSCLKPASYWSSTTSAAFVMRAWSVEFGADGTLEDGNWKSVALFVRAVRRGS